jgi:hypothetical protein
MEPDPCFFGLLDPDPYIISTDSDPVPDPGQGNSMLKIIKQSKHLLRKVIKKYKKYKFFRLGAFKIYSYII